MNEHCRLNSAQCRGLQIYQWSSAHRVQVAQSHVLLTNYVTIVCRILDANKSNYSVTRLALVFSLFLCLLFQDATHDPFRETHIGVSGGVEEAVGLGE
jgi:hypothetical protein